jgi:MFS family permease
MSNLKITETYWRWIVSILVGLYLMGYPYVLDIMGPIEVVLEKDLDISQIQWSMFFSIMSYPGIILAFLGGIIIDNMGHRYSIILFSLVCTFSFAILIVGGLMKSYLVLLAGKLVFGIGGLCLWATYAVVLSKWFNPEEMSLAVSITITTCFIPALFQGWISTALYNEDTMHMPYRLSSVFFVAFCIQVFALVCAVLVCLLDIKRERQSGEVKTEKAKVKLGDIKNFSGSLWIAAAIMMLF